MNRLSIGVVRTLLHHEWDPIGMGPLAEQLGEYDNYVSAIFDLLVQGTSEEALFEVLWRIETDYIGLQGNRTATEAFSKRLVSLVDDASSGKNR